MEIPSLTITCSSQDDKRVNVTLHFRRGEILYDCANVAFVSGDIADSPEMEHARHQIQDIIDDGNVDRVTRILSLAHAEVQELLFPFTKVNVDDSDNLDDVKVDPEEYTVNLNLPAKFSKTTVSLLRHLIHEYIVCRIMQDWLSITYPAAADIWAEKLEDVRQKIRKAKAARTGLTRRKPYPF